MFDIEQELRGILEKYGYTGLKEDCRRNVYREIRNILCEVCRPGARVAVKCAGYHTLRLLEDFGDVLRVDCLLDRNPSQAGERIKALHIPIYTSPDEAGVDKVIISSFEWRNECMRELQGLDGVEAIDLYECLEKAGYSLEKAYYDYQENTYQTVIECQAEYRKCCSRQGEEQLLEQLIGCYLDIRDICSARKCLDLYIDQGFRKSSEMSRLREELEDLLLEIRTECGKRKQKDILWFWQDALAYEYVEEMERLCKTAEKGVFFQEAYTPSPVTRSVYARILDQQEEYDVYHDMDSWPKAHKTVEFLKEKGYHCKKIAGIEQRSIPLDTLDLHHVNLMIQPCAATELWWEALRELLLSSEPVFFLLHGGRETHPPLVSPALEEYSLFELLDFPGLLTQEGERRHRERVKANVKYLDEEWDFFLHLLHEECIKIVMSDHGDIQGKRTKPCGKDLLHTMLAAVGGGVPAKRYSELFCITDFIKLLMYLLEPTQEHEAAMFSDKIWLNAVDYYNKDWVNDWIQAGFPEMGISYCGTLTREDRYVKFGTGEEAYHIFPDEQTNRIADPACQERIDALRAYAGDRFINISRHPKFRYSHLLYEAMGKKHIEEEL